MPLQGHSALQEPIPDDACCLFLTDGQTRIRASYCLLKSIPAVRKEEINTVPEPIHVMWLDRRNIFDDSICQRFYR